MTTRFGADGCTCRAFTRTDPPRYLKIGDTVAADAITSWQKADDCPHHGEQEEPGDETSAAAWTQLEACAFNAVQPALRAVGEWLPLSARRAVAKAVLAAVREHLDIGEEEAWCKTCRRAWDGPRHRCETDAEQRLARARGLHRENCPLATGAVKPPAFTCGMCNALEPQETAA
ncbi:hypothetical protein M2164_005898 [Streptomyces sp. SAI-208]|uniref:hypothetical protein n=1 Tax=Streptomyces sp. SAI-208 TaxID=2940550 RepID=UPI00247682CF|nr:hypothetical protein [Streptomyces sp. SAI-208]MDH6610263.1 hypothetical protein [Streptomyces sp. SAI-208]